MARRRQHEQLNLLDKTGTKPFDRRGGFRQNAGCKPKNGVRAGVSHAKRPDFSHNHPLSVTLRVLPIVKTLRDFDLYPAFRKATMAAARFGQSLGKKRWFRIIHISIQSNHIHLIVEASDRKALARGMQGFQISAAKWLNKAIGKRRGYARTGSVFADRYFARVVTNPMQARRTLMYVLNNWRKHEQDRTLTTSTWRVDPFSSGVSFTGWKDLVALGLPRWRIPDGYEPLTVFQPRTWLLCTGWRRHGLVECSELPTPRMFAKGE